jgi:hypothetical protein
VQIGRGTSDTGGTWRLSGKPDSDGSLCTQFEARDAFVFPDEEFCESVPDAAFPISETVYGDSEGGYRVGVTTRDAARVRIEVNGAPAFELPVIGADKQLDAGFYVAPVGAGILTDEASPAVPLVAVALDVEGNEIGRYDEQDENGVLTPPPPTGPVEPFAEGDDNHGHWKVVAQPTTDGVCLGVGYGDPPAEICVTPTMNDGKIIGGVNLDPDVAVAVVSPEVANVRVQRKKGKPIEVVPANFQASSATARIAIVPLEHSDRVKQLVALDASGKTIGQFDASALGDFIFSAD